MLRLAAVGRILTALMLLALLGATASSAPDGAGRTRGAQLIRVPGSPVVVELWQQRDGNGAVRPRYAISLDGRTFADPRPTSYQIKLRHGDFDPLAPGPLPAIEPGFEAAEDTNLYLVQFVTQPLEDYRRIVRDLGGTVYFFIPYHSHIVKMDEETRDAVGDLPFVRWVGPFHPAYRLETYLLENAPHAEAMFPQATYNIMVFEPGMRQKNAVAAKIARLGGFVERVHAGKFLLEATLTPEQLYEVARFDEVVFIDRWGPYEMDMNNSREISGANYVETVAGYTGEGVRGESFDAGFQVNHIDFASRPLIIHGDYVGMHRHGTACIGVCFGDGTGDPMARGIMPDGQGIVADYNVIGLTGQSRYDHSGELIDLEAVFQTASVGSPQTPEYTTVSADTDAALFDFDIVHCQSQSNEGNQYSRPQAWAKNIISGGGVKHFDTLDTSDDCWCNGASIGPASDGRIKPDLCHFYDYSWTTYTTSTDGYDNFGGTSNATPNICGYTGLFFQMWSDGIFGNPVDPNGSVFENRAHLATAKAMMINTANQYPFEGTGHDLTRVHQGWGLPDLQYMYDMREKMLVVDETDLLTNLGVASYVVAIGPEDGPLKATMTYLDPPGDPGASMQRINDLTLKVTSPSGTVYWGNHGLLEGNWSVPGGEPNDYDTVENVFIEDPELGAWTVEVIAYEINQDSHVETPELDADFALVVSGGQEGPGFGLGVDPTDQAVCAPQDAVYTVDVFQYMGYEEPVALDVNGAPPGASIEFSVNPVVPPGQSELIIGDTGDATPGKFTLQITGTTPDMDRQVLAGLTLATALPGSISLLSPPDGAVDVSVVPTLEWTETPQAASYELQIATDAEFNDVVYAASTEETSHLVTDPLEIVTLHYWRVRGVNICGDGPYSETFSFTTQDIPSVLVVDDDDNGPDVRAFYTDALDSLGIWYDIWDTQNSDNEPSAIDLGPYQVVIWFTGEEYGGFCGPGNAGETALAEWLDGGGCLFISAQDYHYDRGLTGFMSNHLGVADASNDVGQNTVTGAGSVFTGMGPYGLDYPFSNWSDIIEPDADAELAFSGEEGDAAVNKDGGVYRTTFWGFPFEALPSDDDRVEMMQTILDWCGGLIDCPGDLDGDGDVDTADLLALLQAWGDAGGPADLNDDGIVNTADLLLLLEGWGPC
ncbi:MAG: S8 family serine peptidase [Planctomycetota bacterium]|nr:S8 family serine peptidase [Planctomycetota bacterium]